ncbi:hypothetical protein ABL78_3757 [Leptomonas seymouri]|uniref:Uncharacterized protein n=1 Tax=Leptomonas seymouri TaxID=5684 RepID=A0A0N1IL52_LEPSE|nr:hypothetical protein ABL78_3757 [Leptomonas seymouri]|eukprot:KPI87155.1 hypothetical protein ABL78_3757 [Leptomonas seymouri]
MGCITSRTRPTAVSPSHSNRVSFRNDILEINTESTLYKHQMRRLLANPNVSENTVSLQSGQGLLIKGRFSTERFRHPSREQEALSWSPASRRAPATLIELLSDRADEVATPATTRRGRSPENMDFSLEFVAGVAAASAAPPAVATRKSSDDFRGTSSNVGDDSFLSVARQAEVRELQQRVCRRSLIVRSEPALKTASIVPSENTTNEAAVRAFSSLYLTCSELYDDLQCSAVANTSVGVLETSTNTRLTFSDSTSRTLSAVSDSGAKGADFLNDYGVAMFTDSRDTSLPLRTDRPQLSERCSSTRSNRSVIGSECCSRKGMESMVDGLLVSPRSLTRGYASQNYLLADLEQLCCTMTSVNPPTEFSDSDVFTLDDVVQNCRHEKLFSLGDNSIDGSTSQGISSTTTMDDKGSKTAVVMLNGSLLSDDREHMVQMRRVRGSLPLTLHKV